MKKFIQIASLFSLLAVFTVMSANAQSGTYGSEVEIPFAFNVGDQSYEAGHYVIKVQKLTTGAATITISDTKNDKVRIVLLNASADAPQQGVKLVFDNVDGQRYLSYVNTPERTFALVKARPDKVGDSSSGGSSF
jgi:hypothetical protein